jgi:dihydrofolate synthase/folylpolyglutamate synthase
MRGFPMIFGAMRGKRVTAVLRALAPLEPQPLFTRVDNPGAIPTADLQARWRLVAAGTGREAGTPERALRMAAELRRSPDQPVVVAGSLYLVGAVRGILRGEEEDA